MQVFTVGMWKQIYGMRYLHSFKTICLSSSIIIYFVYQLINDTWVFKDYCFVAWLWSIRMHVGFHSGHIKANTCHEIFTLVLKIWLSSSIIIYFVYQPINDTCVYKDYCIVTWVWSINMHGGLHSGHVKADMSHNALICASQPIILWFVLETLNGTWAYRDILLSKHHPWVVVLHAKVHYFVYRGKWIWKLPLENVYFISKGSSSASWRVTLPAKLPDNCPYAMSPLTNVQVYAFLFQPLYFPLVLHKYI